MTKDDAEHFAPPLGHGTTVFKIYEAVKQRDIESCSNLERQTASLATQVAHFWREGS